MAFFSTKTYSPERGLSCCFRQWRATSHCSKLHGYALGFTFVFGAPSLDERNWVVDFGGLGSLKSLLEEMFDHKLVVAADDPDIRQFQGLEAIGAADVVVLPNVGCEAFALIAYDIAEAMCVNNDELRERGVWVEQVTCFEHTGNSAIYKMDIEQ